MPIGNKEERIRRYIDFVSEPAKREPEKTAVVGNQKRLNFAELDLRVGKLGEALRSAGLKMGDRVAVLAKNELEYAEIQAACHRSGFVLVPLNNRLAIPELEFILNDSTPKILIGGREEHDRVKKLSSMVESVRKPIGLGDPEDIESYDDFIADALPDPAKDPLDSNLISSILYTSGTTGKPKGAIIDRNVLTARAFFNAIELQYTEDDIFVEALPMFHIASGLAYAALFVGATVVMLPEFKPEKCLDLLEKEKATVTVLVPTMIKMLLECSAIENFDSSHLRLITYGGESIAPPILKSAIEYFKCGFHQQYGMTETAMSSALRCKDHLSEDAGVIASAGKDAVACEVRIVDNDDNEVPFGESGEIVCNGPCVMRGYWQRPEENTKTLRNGWMHTGDIGRRDEKGYLHVVDRKNNMIVSGGENIYPLEIELLLFEHPQVTEAAVVGLPDPKWGERVTCCFVGDADEKDLETYLRESIAGYKIPRRWIRMKEQLPKNSVGKILKHDLKKLLIS